MLQLRQFYLHLAFMALGPLGKDIKNETGSVNHPDLQNPFKVTLLCWRQGMIENDDVEMLVLDSIRNFLRLARTDVQGRIRTGTPAEDGEYRFGSG
jgi:hypothetical protein